MEGKVCCKIQELYEVTNFRNDFGGGVGLKLSDPLSGFYDVLVRVLFKSTYSREIQFGSSCRAVA